jgi:hypothetical protein
VAEPVIPPPPPGFTLDSIPPPPPGFTLDTSPSSSNTSVVINAANKGMAALPDMILNAPNKVLNLGRAAVGTALTAAGKPDLAPELTPDPDYARRAMEAAGAIKPDIVPQGGMQRGLDAVTQGVVGGAMTAGASVPATVAGAVLGGVSGGAGQAATEATGNPAWGAVAGMAVPAAAAKIAGSAGNLRPDVRRLNDEGVQMTPGQIKGGAIQRFEDSLTSVPVLGDAIKSAQRRGQLSYNTALYNIALRPVGETMPAGLQGNAAVAHVQDRLGARYDALRARMRGSLDGPIQNGPTLPSNQPQRPTLRQELGTIRQMGANLPPAQRTQLDRIIQDEVIDRFTQGGRTSGETIKNIESKLGGMATTFGRSDNYDVRILGGAVKEAQAALRRMVEAENPRYAQELERINAGYAVFKTIQRAASSVAAEGGVVTPAQIHSAVKANDGSKDHSRFARGEALIQDVTQSGKSVLSPTVPDSGTARRGMTGAGVVGGLGHFINQPEIAAGILASSLPYTPWGQRLSQAYLTRQANPQLEEAINRAGVIVPGMNK